MDKLTQRNLLAIKNAADTLMSFLEANAGDTADWPIHIHVDCPIKARLLALNMTDLHNALKKYNKNDPLTTKEITGG